MEFYVLFIISSDEVQLANIAMFYVVLFNYMSVFIEPARQYFITVFADEASYFFAVYLHTVHIKRFARRFADALFMLTINVRF